MERMMDYGAIGEAMGMGLAIRNSRQAAAIADDEIAKANAIIQSKNDEIARLRRELAETKGKLNVQIAHTDGLLAQARLARAEIAKMAPKHYLLVKTGLRYENGVEQVQFQKVFEAAFDKKATDLGLPGPVNQYRLNAK